MNLTNEQKDEFLQGTLTPNNVVEIVGNDALGWADLLEYAFKQYSNLLGQKKFAETKRYELVSNISSAEDWFQERLEDGSTDEDDLIRLAEIFGWVTTKDVEVTITITASGTVSVPIGSDLSDLTSDLDVSIDAPSYSDFIVDVSVDDIDISEN
jgi:hypothetical protein